MRAIVILPLVCLLAHSIAAEDVTALREKGIAALKESESNPRTVVEAARLFARAADLYAAAGDDAKATEMNSFLYWCKKKMSYQDIEQFTKSGDTVTAEKLNAIEKLTPKNEDAKKWLDRAERYAKDNPTEHFLIATRFFEVASRFVGTKESIAAQERSLKEQGLSLAKAAATKPAVTTAAKAGKKINLLTLIDVTKDVVSGKWGFTGTTLMGDKNEYAKIEIPYQPPEEYDFKIVFMRMEGDDSVVQHLNKAEHQFVWNMDALHSRASGLELIAGKSAHDNETSIGGQMIQNNRWCTSVVQVRNTGITVLFDGKTILKYSKPYELLSMPPKWRLHDITALGLGHWGSRIAFQSAELIEITGTGKKTR